jgi:hypothetical protein
MEGEETEVIDVTDFEIRPEYVAGRKYKGEYQDICLQIFIRLSTKAGELSEHDQQIFGVSADHPDIWVLTKGTITNAVFGAVEKYTSTKVNYKALMEPLVRTKAIEKLAGGTWVAYRDDFFYYPDGQGVDITMPADNFQTRTQAASDEQLRAITELLTRVGVLERNVEVLTLELAKHLSDA